MMTVRRLAVLAVGLLAGALFQSPARADGVSVALSPATQIVATGSQFDVTLEVTAANPAFNAFSLKVAFDPAVLTPVRLSPLGSQIGALMSSNCNNLFHQFRTGAGVDSIDVAQLCAGDVLGPGTIYRLRFQASNVVRSTNLQILPGAVFANGGLLVTPVTTSEATVQIVAPVPTRPSTWGRVKAVYR